MICHVVASAESPCDLCRAPNSSSGKLIGLKDGPVLYVWSISWVKEWGGPGQASVYFQSFNIFTKTSLVLMEDSQ